MDFSSLLGGMGSGGGGGPSSSATSGVSQAGDTFDSIPAAPPPVYQPGASHQPAWFWPAIIGGVALVIVLLFTRK